MSQVPLTQPSSLDPEEVAYAEMCRVYSTKGRIRKMINVYLSQRSTKSNILFVTIIHQIQMKAGHIICLKQYQKSAANKRDNMLMHDISGGSQMYSMY